MRIGVWLVSLLLLASSVAAAPVGWTVEGTVTEHVAEWDSPLTSDFPVGQSFTVTLFADPAAVDLCDSPASGLYETPGATVTVGGSSWTASATFWEVNNMAGSCAIEYPGVVTRSFFTDAPFSLLTLGWGTMADETFPGSVEAGYAWFAEVGWAPTVMATTDVSGETFAVVPEPASGLLLLGGLIAMRRKRSAR